MGSLTEVLSEELCSRHHSPLAAHVLTAGSATVVTRGERVDIDGLAVLMAKN